MVTTFGKLCPSAQASCRVWLILLVELGFGLGAWHCVPSLLSEFGKKFWERLSSWRCRYNRQGRKARMLVLLSFRVNVNDFRFLACFARLHHFGCDTKKGDREI